MKRASLVVCGAVVLNWSFLLYGSNDAYPFLVWFEVILGVTGLGILVMGLANATDFHQRLSLVSFLATVAGFLLWSWVQIRLQPNYGTDEIAFNEYAARLLQHGQNPYQNSMQPAFDLFRVSPNGFTLRLDGTPVDTFSYPSLSFLTYLPLLLMGFQTQVGVLTNVALWAIVGFEMYLLAPRRNRSYVPAIFSIAAYTGFAVGGVTDPLYLVFLIPSIRYLYQFDTANRVVKWISPIGLGLAIAVKQTPWILAPFLIAALFLEARTRFGNSDAWRKMWKFCWITGLIAFIPNLPFALWSFRDWLEGVLTPIRGGLVPAGQGLIAISTFLGLGGGNLTYVGVATVLVVLVLLLAQLIAPQAIGRSFLIFPAIILFCASRSFATYLIMMLPAAMVAEQPTGSPSQLSENLQSKLRIGLRLLGGALIIVLAKSLLTEPPLYLKIQSIHTTGQLATVSEVKVQVTNRTDKQLTPQFAIQSGGALTIPWHIENPKKSIGPGESSVIILTSPNFPSQPRLTGGFQVAALIVSPGSLSISDTYRPTNWHIAMSPQAVNNLVQIGVPVNLSCQLLDEMNRPVRVAGVPIFMGQVTYAQSGIVFSQAVINSGGIGQTPVVARTDRQGRAVFVVRGTEATRDPIYFEANLVNSESHFPYGYSEIVPIRFGVN